MAGRPYVVERGRIVAASPAAVFALVDDFREWVNWSPWEGLDPDVKRSYSGPAKGVGSRYAWSGNRKAGAGSMTITDVDAPDEIHVDLSFERPFSSTSKVVFRFEPEGERSTSVTWRMSGESSGAAKLFNAVVSMDRLVGKDFERGLDNLARVAEAR